MSLSNRTFDKINKRIQPQESYLRINSFEFGEWNEFFIVCRITEDLFIEKNIHYREGRAPVACKGFWECDICQGEGNNRAISRPYAFVWHDGRLKILGISRSVFQQILQGLMLAESREERDFKEHLEQRRNRPLYRKIFDFFSFLFGKKQKEEEKIPSPIGYAKVRIMKESVPHSPFPRYNASVVSLGHGLSDEEEYEIYRALKDSRSLRDRTPQ